MPDPTRPTPASPVKPDELNFAQPPEQTPRIKRRSLRPKAAPAAKPVGETAAASAPAPTAPNPIRTPQADSVEASRAAAARSTSNPPSPSPFSPNPSPSTQPHPATLYYSTGARKEKEDSPPMKSSIPVGSTSASSSSSVSPIRAGTPAARAASVVDYRANIERQAREQKSVGSLIHYAVYALGAVLLLGLGLAGYGTYVLSKQIHEQSVTVNDLDTRFSDKAQTLTAQLATTDDSLAQAEAQIKREQDVILHQQDAINKLITANDAAASALREERQARAGENATRAGEIASLRSRVHTLESTTRFSP